MSEDGAIAMNSCSTSSTNPPNTTSTNNTNSVSGNKIIQRRWVCDVCKVKWFLGFEEACAHEATCQGVPSSSEPSSEMDYNTNDDFNDGASSKRKSTSDETPSTSGRRNKSIKVANESAKLKDDTEKDIALAKEQSTAVPSPVASSQLKQEGSYDDDTDEDIAPDTIKSVQVKTEEDVYGEETDEEDGKLAAVLSNAVSGSNTNVTRNDDGSDFNDSDSDDESDVDEEAKTISRWDASNEEFNKTAKVYLWCEGKGQNQAGRPPGYGGLVILPYNWYLFYEKIKRCKTWGDIRTICDNDTYQTLVDRYELNCEYCSDDETNLTDSKSFYMDQIDLSEHESYGDETVVGMFPPVIEQVMFGAAINKLPCGRFRGSNHNGNPHNWMLDPGNVEETWYSELWLKFDSGEKDKIFKKIEELGCTVKYFPKLGQKFTSIYEM